MMAASPHTSHHFRCADYELELRGEGAVHQHWSCSRPCRALSSRSVIVDGRAVVFACDPDRLLELDETQTLWWSLLDGTELATIVDDVAAMTGTPVAEVAAIVDAVIVEFDRFGLLDR